MFLSRVWAVYLHSVSKAPFLTKSLTGLFITGGGDVLAQLYEGADTINLQRLRNLSLYGLVVTGATEHFWYRAVDRIFGAKMTFAIAVKKTLFEQVTFSPFETALFMTWAHVASGRTHELPDKYRGDLLTVLIANATVWIPVQILNFKLIPEPLRVLYTCVVNTVWNGFMSYASHNSLQES